MRRPFLSACIDCKYFSGAKAGTCDAFPNQIPSQIWTGRIKHDKPIPGDKGIRFEPKDAGEFLSIAQIAKLLNLDPKTIYRAVWGKSLPAYKIGRTWRIAKRDIEHFRN